MLNFAMWQNPKVAISPKQMKIMIDLQIQLTNSNQFFDRAQLKVLYKDLHDLVEKRQIASSDMPLVAKFAKTYKVNWQDLIMLLGTQLNDPLDVLIAYKPSKYIKEIAKRFLIPIVDLSDDATWNRLEDAAYDGRGVKFIKGRIDLAHSGIQKTMAIVARDEESGELVLSEVAISSEETA